MRDETFSSSAQLRFENKAVLVEGLYFNRTYTPAFDTIIMARPPKTYIRVSVDIARKIERPNRGKTKTTIIIFRF